MSEITNTATIRVVADASGVEAGLRPAIEAARNTERAVAQVGAGAATSARNLEAAQRNIIQAIQRTTIAMEAGGKSTAAYYESIANHRGFDSTALAPYIAQLRAVEEAQARAAQSALAQQAAQQQAAEATRAQASAQRELAQAQATRDNFVAGLREQVALFGASTEEVLRYRAAQAGAAEAAEPLIAQMHAMRAAQEQATQAARADAEAARAQAAAQRELAQAQANREAFISSLREQIQLFGRSTDEVLAYRAAQAGASQESAQLILQLRNMRAAQEQVAQAARDQAEAQRAAAREQSGRDSFIDGLRQQSEAIGRTRVELLELRAAQLGVSNQAAPFIARLREADGGLSHVGVSAAQTAAALRGVPAQFTDIITSIQGGQAPLTVLFQQGGQLRDMFGSAGGAARALGGYVMGLVNPYTVAAGAALGLAYAYSQGSKEGDAYNRSIIMSGNVAGTSRNQLADYAREISKTIGTQSDASKALVGLTDTGKVGADNLKQFGQVAVTVQREIGRSIDDTVKDFAELGKSPLQASLKLNEAYHFLTASTLAQIKALEDQGRADDAAEVAQKAYANAFADRATKMRENLGMMEGAWRSVKDVAASAWDAFLGVGRKTTPQQELDQVNAEIARASKKASPFYENSNDAELRGQLPKLKARKVELELAIDKDKWESAQAGITQKLDEAQQEWNKIGDKFLTREQQRAKEIAAIRQKGLEAGASDQDINAAVARANQSYADLFNAGIDSNIAALKRRDQVADVIEQRELARIAALRTAGGMTEDDAINATANAELAAFTRKRALLDAELAQTRLKANSIKEQKDLLGEMDVLDEQVTSRRIQRTNDLFAAEQRRYRQAVENSANLIEKDMVERASLIQQTQAQLDYNEAIGLSQKQIASLTAARLLDAAARKDAEADIAEGLDLTGQRAARIRDEAAAIRERAAAVVEGAAKSERYDQWKQAIDQYGQVFQQGFADMLNNGQAGWKSFTHSLVTTFKTSVADQIYKMFARPFVVQMVGSFMGISQQAIAGEIAAGGGATAAGAAGGAGAGAAAGLGALFGAGGLGGSLMAGAGWMTGATTLSGSLGAAGSLIGTGSAAGIASGIGMGIGAIAPIALGILAGSVLLKKAFGMGDKEVTGQGISGTLSSSGLMGQGYSTWHQDGGWFRSDRNGTDTKALTDAMVKQFTEGLGAIESASAGFASSLGVQADWIKDYSKTFDLKLTGDATKDQQAIADFFQGIGDEIAQKLVPNLDTFARSGELLSTTLQRLAGDFQGTDRVAQLLGFSADKLFGSSGLGSAGAREQLIDMAGGLQSLSSAAAFFNQNFLSDAERIKPVAEALDKALASLGLDTIPTTRDQFKGLVNDLITSGAAATESGAKQLDSLLALGEAFAQVHPAIDAVAAAADAAAAAAEKAAAAIQAIKDSASSLLGDVDGAYSVLQNVVNREKAAVQTSVDVHSAAVAKLQSLSQALRSTLDSIQSPEQKLFARASAQAEIHADLAITRAGGALSDAQIESLKKALGAVNQDAAGQFGSYQDYLRDLYQTQNDISKLGDVTDDSLSVEQKALDAAKEQLKSLDQVLLNGQQQVDELKGANVNGLTLIQAMAGLTKAILAAKDNPIVAATGAITGAYQQYLGRAPDAEGMEWWKNAAAGGAPVSQIVDGIKGSTEASLNSLYQTYLDRAPDPEGLKFWMGQYGATMDATETADWMKAAQKDAAFKGIPGFASGGMFGGGLRLVGENGPELEATGPARIWSSNQTAALLSRAGSGSGIDVSELATEMRELRKENAQLRADLNAGLRAIATHTMETKDTLDKWDVVGQPATRTD